MCFKVPSSSFLRSCLMIIILSTQDRLAVKPLCPSTITILAFLFSPFYIVKINPSFGGFSMSSKNLLRITLNTYSPKFGVFLSSLTVFHFSQYFFYFFSCYFLYLLSIRICFGFKQRIFFPFLCQHIFIIMMVSQNYQY